MDTVQPNKWFVCSLNDKQWYIVTSIQGYSLVNTLATSVQYGEERDDRGSVVKPILRMINAYVLQLALELYVVDIAKGGC